MHLSDCPRLVGLRLKYTVNNAAMMDDWHSCNINIELHYNVHMSKYIHVLLHVLGSQWSIPELSVSWLNIIVFAYISTVFQNGFLDTQWLQDKAKTKDEFLSNKEAFLSTRSRLSSCRRQLDKLTNDRSTRHEYVLNKEVYIFKKYIKSFLAHQCELHGGLWSCVTFCLSVCASRL